MRERRWEGEELYIHTTSDRLSAGGLSHTRSIGNVRTKFLRIKKKKEIEGRAKKVGPSRSQPYSFLSDAHFLARAIFFSLRSTAT
jgi:hypothetical protein